MTFKAICRTGDIVTGVCFNHRRHRGFTGTWDPHAGNVEANSLQVIREGDLGSTNCGHKFKANGGSDNVIANGLKLQRVGDTVTVIGGGNGVSITGSDNTTSY